MQGVILTTVADKKSSRFRCVQRKRKEQKHFRNGNGTFKTFVYLLANICKLSFLLLVCAVTIQIQTMHETVVVEAIWLGHNLARQRSKDSYRVKAGFATLSIFTNI